MESSCTFGFEDLFWAAHARAWTPLERRALEEASQDARNALVRSWARTAGQVTLEDRRGTDGRVYSAFCFDRPDWWSRLRWLAPLAGELAVAAFGPPPDAVDPGGDAAPARTVATAPPMDPDAGPVVLVVARTGGPLVPGKAVVVTHGRNVRDAVIRVRAAILGIDTAVVHVAVTDAAAGDLAEWLGTYLRAAVA
jgi:hypothetical protein